jgi:hypothetical protein
MSFQSCRDDDGVVHLLVVGDSTKIGMPQPNSQVDSWAGAVPDLPLDQYGDVALEYMVRLAVWVAHLVLAVPCHRLTWFSRCRHLS